MTKVAEVTIRKGRKPKVECFQLGIYKILKEQLGFRYQKINGKGYYLRLKNHNYIQVQIFDLRRSFLEYIENHFEGLEISELTTLEDFQNAFYQQRPINKNSGWNKYLNDDFSLTKENLELILKSK